MGFPKSSRQVGYESNGVFRVPEDVPLYRATCVVDGTLEGCVAVTVRAWQADIIQLTYVDLNAINYCVSIRAFRVGDTPYMQSQLVSHERPPPNHHPVLELQIA